MTQTIKILFFILISATFLRCGDEVSPVPIASFDTGIEYPGIFQRYVDIGSLILFVNNSQNAVHYEWFFGDGTSSNLESPNHSYNEVGSYEIVLVATGDDGTTSIDKKMIFVGHRRLKNITLNSLEFTPPDGRNSWDPEEVTSCPDVLVIYSNKSKPEETFLIIPIAGRDGKVCDFELPFGGFVGTGADPFLTDQIWILTLIDNDPDLTFLDANDEQMFYVEFNPFKNEVINSPAGSGFAHLTEGTNLIGETTTGFDIEFEWIYIISE